MADAFGVGAVAVRDESVLLEVDASAHPRIANEASGTDRLRPCPLDAIGVRLWAVEFQRDRNIERHYCLKH